MTKKESDGLYALIAEWREFSTFNPQNEERCQALIDCADDLLDLIEGGFELRAYDND